MKKWCWALVLVVGLPLPAYSSYYVHLSFPSGVMGDLVGIGFELGRVISAPPRNLGNYELLFSPLSFGFCVQFARTHTDTLGGEEISTRYATLSFPLGMKAGVLLPIPEVPLAFSAGLNIEPTFYLYHRSARPINAPPDSLGQTASRNDFYLYISLPLELQYHLDTFTLDLVLKPYIVQFHSGRRPDIGGVKFGIGVSF